MTKTRIRQWFAGRFYLTRIDAINPVLFGALLAIGWWAILRLDTVVVDRWEWFVSPNNEYVLYGAAYHLTHTFSYLFLLIMGIVGVYIGHTYGKSKLVLPQTNCDRWVWFVGLAASTWAITSLVIFEIDWRFL